MVNKRTLLFIVLSQFSFNLFGAELQFKWLLPTEDKAQEIRSTKQLGQIPVHFHSTYVYFDLYLDTPSYDLYKNNLSLRLRKRTFEDGTIDYDFQLKSEMDEGQIGRMEIEENDLSFYSTKQGEQRVFITTYLDRIFKEIEHEIPNRMPSSTFYNDLKQLESWFQLKKNSSLAPFQKLRHLFKGTSIISKLSPQLMGVSKRSRAHLYLTPELAVKNNLKKIFETKIAPIFFQENLDFIHLFEISVDEARFISVIEASTTGKVHEIRELEVENKYPDIQIGQKIYQQISKDLKGIIVVINYTSIN